MGTQFIKCYAGFDPDALAYIQAVELADGAALESTTRQAIDRFVRGCKSDGIWNAIKACCIMAGARTLSGCLVPLKGTAPTNFNFVSADYNRKTGLKGDGTSKQLNSNRANNSDPQNSNHNAVYVTSLPLANTNTVYMGTSSAVLGRNVILPARSAGVIGFTSRAASVINDNPGVSSDNLGFIGHTRSLSTSYTARAGGVNIAINSVSTPPVSTSIFIFSYESASLTSGRISFYSIGESIDLAMLDSRITQLMTDINNAF
jgi:hypothetical protein